MQGEIYVSVQYKPIFQDPLWNSGVLGSSRGKEDQVPDGAVPHVYFPLRKGCRVTMYNDAHQVRAVHDPRCSTTSKAFCGLLLHLCMHLCAQQTTALCCLMVCSRRDGDGPAGMHTILDILMAWLTPLHLSYIGIFGHNCYQTKQ